MKLTNNVYRQVNDRESMNKYLKGYSDIIKRLFDAIPNGEFALLGENNKAVGIQIKFENLTVQYKFANKYEQSTVLRIVGNGKNVTKENVDVNATLKEIRGVARSLNNSKKNKLLKNNRTVSDVFMAIQSVCREHGIECPDNVWDEFYQDMLLAVSPNFFGDDSPRNNKYRFSSRRLNNEVQMYEVNYEYEDRNGQTIKAVDKVSAESEEEAKEIAIEAYRNNNGTKDIVGDIKPYLVKPVQNSRRIKSAKEEKCGDDACVLTPFGEIDRTVANADFTDKSFKAYVVEPYAEDSDEQFVVELETKGNK